MDTRPFFVKEFNIYTVNNMTQPEQHIHSEATADINLATFIKVIKSIETKGHFFKGQQLWIRFHITEKQLASFKEEYLNSPFAFYDATRHT